MYHKTTHNISVTVQPIYLDEQSSPEENYFVWAYNVKIENGGSNTVQLRRTGRGAAWAAWSWAARISSPMN